MAKDDPNKFNTTLERVFQALRHYEKQYRKPDLKPWERSGVYDLFPEKSAQTEFAPRYSWPDFLPFSDNFGLVFVFDDLGFLSLVKKASLNRCIRDVVRRYFDDHGDLCQVIHADQWLSTPRYIVTLAVDNTLKFEAAGLEAYLIEKLDPPQNALWLKR